MAVATGSVSSAHPFERETFQKLRGESRRFRETDFPRPIRGVGKCLSCLTFQNSSLGKSLESLLESLCFHSAGCGLQQISLAALVPGRVCRHSKSLPSAMSESRKARPLSLLP